MSYCDSTELIRPVSATFETADYAVFASMLSLSGLEEKNSDNACIFIII